jgi:membrane-bound lytic murein transglycosylase D
MGAGRGGRGSTRVRLGRTGSGRPGGWLGRWAVRALAPALAGVTVSACGIWGSGAPGPPVPEAEPTPYQVFLQAEREGLHPLDPGRVHRLRFQVEGIDPILHTSTALDPGLQARTGFWVSHWTERRPEDFRRYLERMARYQDLVDGELGARDLPNALRYLPIVESGYRSSAVSRVGATGLWQIMSPTARALALTVSPIVDDRRDPVTNTRAALDYLEELYDSFGSWYLALAAYNAGPARVRSVLARHAPDPDISPDLRFLMIRPHLPSETREFVPKLLAAAHLARDAEELGLLPPERSAPLAFDEVVVADATSMDVVAWAAGVDEGEVLALNPQYLRGFTPPGQTRVVRVPPGTGERFRERYAEIPPEDRLTFLEHVVSSGETFTHIARRYRVPLAELLAANSRIDPRRLQIGTRVVVPVGAGVRAGS